MRNLKKFLALVLAMLMVVSATAVVSADFTDTADSDYSIAINDLAVKGIVRGTSDTTFTPDADVQRYQMALFVARATTGEVGVEADSTLWANGIVPFTDVTDFKGAIQYAFLNGIIKGRTETIFDPAGNIAYVEALTMAVRALGYTDLEYPWGFYGKAVDLGLTANVDVEGLYTTLDRAETAQIIYNMIYAERADSDVSFATENFDLDVVRTSDLFVITATPLQSYAEGYNSVDYKEEGTYVGVQAVVNGVPEGDLIYIPVEKLGIEAADVEDYLNYAVELINYSEETGEYYDAKLGADPDKVYAADVKFDDNSATKIVIDGTTYNIVETVSGTVLKNELVAFAGSDINTYTAKVLVVIGDSVVDANGNIVATFKGYVGNTKYYAAHADDAANGIVAGTIISEDKALAAWGYEAQGTEYIKYSTLSADEIETLGAFELQLFDDDNNGKYDRAVANTVYMSVYGTYEAEINNKKSGKETVDVIASLFADAAGDNNGTISATEAVDADLVTYSEELTVGTLFTFTYNSITNKIDVIETFDLNTAKLNKIDTTADNGTFKLTFGETVYTAQNGYDAADLGAILVDYDFSDDGVLSLENLNDGVICDTIDNWEKFLKTNALGYEYNFYTVNGFVIFAEAVEEAAAAAAKTEFVVLDSVADFDFGKMDLNVYADGEEKVVALNKFKGITLADLPSWYYGLFIGKVENFFKGSIYAINNTVDGINVLGIVNDETYEEYTETVSNREVPILEYIDITADQDLTTTVGSETQIIFDRGIVRTSDAGDLDYSKRIRTNAKTVFYFIDYGTGIDNEADTEIAVYVGAPEEGTITLDSHTYILVDRIGYNKNNPTQGTTQLIIVVNALDYDFDVEAESEYYGYFIGDEDVYVADDATDLGLEGYAKNAKFYEYKDGAIDVDTGKAITVYAPVPNLEPGMIYEFDANGVVLGYEEMTTSNVDDYELDFADLIAIDDDKYANFDGMNMAIDYLAEEKTYDVTVDVGTTDEANIFDYDDYVITKITLINLGDKVELLHNGTTTLTYDNLTSTSAWNMVVNFFGYRSQLTAIDVFAVQVSKTEILLYVDAE